MEEIKQEAQQQTTSSMNSLSLLKSMRPSYFLQTKEGGYNGMIKHNLLEVTRSSVGSSLSYTELAAQAGKLQRYSEATGKSALTYFNLINGNEEEEKKSGMPATVEPA